jgi:hypothetical protein
MAEHSVIVTFGAFELDDDRRRVDRDAPDARYLERRGARSATGP